MRKISTLCLLLLSMLPATSPSWSMEDPALSKGTGSSSSPPPACSSSVEAQKALQTRPASAGSTSGSSGEDLPPLTFADLPAEMRDYILGFVYQNPKDFLNFQAVNHAFYQHAQEYLNRQRAKFVKGVNSFVESTRTLVTDSLLPTPTAAAPSSSETDENNLSNWYAVLKNRLQKRTDLSGEEILKTFEGLAQASENAYQQWKEVLTQAPAMVELNPKYKGPLSEEQKKLKEAVATLYMQQMGLNDYIQDWRDLKNTTKVQTALKQLKDNGHESILIAYEDRIKQAQDSLDVLLRTQREFLHHVVDCDWSKCGFTQLPPPLQKSIIHSATSDVYYPVYVPFFEQVQYQKARQDIKNLPLQKKLFHDKSLLWLSPLQMLLRAAANLVVGPLVRGGYRLYAYVRQQDPNTPTAQKICRQITRGLTTAISVLGPVTIHLVIGLQEEAQALKEFQKKENRYFSNLTIPMNPAGGRYDPDRLKGLPAYFMVIAHNTLVKKQARNRSPWNYVPHLLLCAFNEAVEQGCQYLHQQFLDYAQTHKHKIPDEKRAELRNIAWRQYYHFNKSTNPESAKAAVVLEKIISFILGYNSYKLDKYTLYLTYLKENHLLSNTWLSKSWWSYRLAGAAPIFSFFLKVGELAVAPHFG